jgi:hypothetical protein
MLKAFECFSSLSEPSRRAGSVRRGKVKDRPQVLLDEYRIAVRIFQPEAGGSGAAFVGFVGEHEPLRLEAAQTKSRPPS